PAFSPRRRRIVRGLTECRQLERDLPVASTRAARRDLGKFRVCWRSCFASARARSLLWRDRPDLDVAEGNLPVIALERKITAVGLRKERHRREFAFGNALLEIVAAQHVIEIFHAVDVVLTFLRADNKTDVVPLAGGFGGINRLAGLGVRRRLIKGVEPAPALRGPGFRVVLKLEFGARRPGRSALVRDMKHDAAVPAFGDVVVELQVEPVELLTGDEVAGVVGIDAGECAVFDLPAGSDTVAFEVVPAMESFPVEKELPSSGFFRVGERVDLRVIGGGKPKHGRCNESKRSQLCVFHRRRNYTNSRGTTMRMLAPPSRHQLLVEDI